MSKLSIAHLLAVLPARERLERAQMPAVLREREPNTNLERLQSRLGPEGGSGLVDLIAPLERAREERPVYLRTDSGLSVWGAAAVAQAMLAEEATEVAGLSVLGPRELRLRTVRGYRGDLAGCRATMAEGDLSVELPPSSVPPDALGEEAELFASGELSALRAPTPAHLSDLEGPRPPLVFECEGAADLRIGLLGVDLPPALVAVLSERAGRCVTIDRAEPPMEAIELELPHIVLHVIHERDLPKLVS
jgi:hypothetical protein